MKIWKNVDLIGPSELYKDLLENFLDVCYKISALKVKMGTKVWCVTKTDGKTIDDTIKLDLVMAMYNLIEYSSNYSYATYS